ncbi:hypothetical protein QBC43DRAFT_216548, partial [Cladorrhinum sp. PSN259]
DQSQQRTSYLCTFPRFPVHRQGESVPNNRTSFHTPPSRYSTPRTLPPFTSSDLDHLSQKKPPVYPRQRILPVAQQVKPLSLNSTSPPSPPKRHQRSHSRTVFTSTTARPLRLVEESRQRKRRPTVFYATHSHSIVQSVTYITINQDYSPHTADMASNPVMPKVAPPPPLSSLPPLPNSATGVPPSLRSYMGGSDRLLADLRRQLDDSASEASSVDSRGRRRRRNNKQLAQAGAGGLTQPAILPRLADTKPVRLQLGLNLDVEVELKARLQGDVSLTLLVEEKRSARPTTSAELKPDWFGVVQSGPDEQRERSELFYMRIGELRFRQAWIEREVSRSLTLAVMLAIGLAGFLVGVGVSRWWDLFDTASTTRTDGGGDHGGRLVVGPGYGRRYGFGSLDYGVSSLSMRSVPNQTGMWWQNGCF